jgi:hypothetical protein
MVYLTIQYIRLCILCVAYRCKFTISDTVGVMVPVALIAHHTPNKLYVMALNGLLQEVQYVILRADVSAELKSKLPCPAERVWGIFSDDALLSLWRLAFDAGPVHVRSCGGQSGTGECHPSCRVLRFYPGGSMSPILHMLL